jgi:hypothetical protein
MSKDYDANEDAAIMAYLATQYRHFGFLIPIDDDDDQDTSKTLEAQ